jgi:IS5 family transposase
MLLIQQLYNISDEQLEYQVHDRLSFRRCLGLELEAEVPDATSVWLFRKHLESAGLIEGLFEQFNAYLQSQGYKAKGGQIICKSYGWLDPHQRQVCWTHLLRDFQAMAQRPGASAEIGEALLRREYRLFHWWYRVRYGTLCGGLFHQAVAQLRIGLVAELEAAANLPMNPKAETPFTKKRKLINDFD